MYKLLFSIDAVLLLLLLPFEKTNGIKIKCNELRKKALPMTDILKDQLDGSVYWTKIIYRKDYVHSSPPPSFGVIRNPQLVRTFLETNDSIMVSHGFTTSVKNSKIIELWSNSYSIDDELAIFEADKMVRRLSIQSLKNGRYKYRPDPKFKKPHMLQRGNVKFGLIYANEDHSIRIFQLCRKKGVAWVQIRDDVMEYHRRNLSNPTLPYLEEIKRVLDEDYAPESTTVTTIPSNSFLCDVDYADAINTL